VGEALVISDAESRPCKRRAGEGARFGKRPLHRLLNGNEQCWNSREVLLFSSGEDTGFQRLLRDVKECTLTGEE
jgi:hypothetical protein